MAGNPFKICCHHRAKYTPKEYSMRKIIISHLGPSRMSMWETCPTSMHTGFSGHPGADTCYPETHIRMAILSHLRTEFAGTQQTGKNKTNGSSHHRTVMRETCKQFRHLRMKLIGMKFSWTVLTISATLGLTFIIFSHSNNDIIHTPNFCVKLMQYIAPPEAKTYSQQGACTNQVEKRQTFTNQWDPKFTNFTNPV